MKRKKILLMLSLAMMGVTTASLTNGFAATINANAYSTGVTVSEDGYTKSVTNSYTLTSADAGKKIYSEVDGLLVDQKSGKYLSSGKLTNINALYFEIPDEAATGTVSITCAGSNTQRFVYYVDSNGAALTTGTKFSYAGSNKIVSNTFSSTDLVTLEGYEGKYFLGLSSNGTDYKFKYISVELDRTVSKNFNGSLAEKHNVNYYSTDGLTQYTELTEVVELGSSPTVYPVLDDVEGQKFAGWASEVNGTVVVDPTTYTMGTEDLNFYAVWEEVTTHTVTITDYEGAEPRTLTFNEGDVLVVDNPQEREGYEFLGWYTTSTFDEGTEVTSETTVTTDMNVYGKWGEATYVYVTFDVDGVTQEYRTIEGHTLSSWPEDPSIAGFSFYGWYDAEGVEYTKDTVFTSNVTLYAKMDVILTSTYNFTNYTTEIGSVAADEVVLDEIVSIRDFNKQVDKAASVDGISFTKGVQAKSVVVNLKYNAEVTVYAAQTGNNKTRKVAVIDNDGFMHYTDIDLGSGQTAMAFTLSLHAGKNEICGFDYVTYDNASIKFNYYGVKIDYTNRDTISVINDTKGYKLSNQAGYDASHNKAMRFVGEIDYTLVDEMASIYVSTSVNKIVDGLPASEVLGSEYIYTVYDRVTLSEAPNAKYGVKDNRLYFYYIIDGVQDDYQTITCDATITLQDGTMYKLTSTFDCVNAYAE